MSFNCRCCGESYGGVYRSEDPSNEICVNCFESAEEDNRAFRDSAINKLSSVREQTISFQERTIQQNDKIIELLEKCFESLVRHEAELQDIYQAIG